MLKRAERCYNIYYSTERYGTLGTESESVEHDPSGAVRRQGGDISASLLCKSHSAIKNQITLVRVQACARGH